MEPVACKHRKAGSAAALRHLALMVGKDVVFAARVDVNLITKQHARHSAAFNMPTGVALAPWGWPAHEVAALNAARIAGKSDDEIRILVQQLESARKSGTVGGGRERS